jgi:hypothetical protein
VDGGVAPLEDRSCTLTVDYHGRDGNGGSGGIQYGQTAGGGGGGDGGGKNALGFMTEVDSFP